jgi:quercetin dioxygenase-like cupin family protein
MNILYAAASILWFGFAYAIGAVPPAAAQSVYSGDGAHIIAPGQLTWTDAPSVAPGAKIAVIEGPLNKPVPFTFRLMIPANSKVAPHTHPAYERVTVLSGTFYVAEGGRFDPARAKALHAGSVAIVPPDTAMFGYTKEEGAVIQLHGTGPWGLKPIDSAANLSKN